MLASKPFPGLCVAVLGCAAPLPWGACGSTPRQGGPGRAGGLTLPSAQDCLRAIGSFLRTHRHVTSVLTGAGLAAMVRPRPRPHLLGRPAESPPPREGRGRAALDAALHRAGPDPGEPGWAEGVPASLPPPDGGDPGEAALPAKLLAQKPLPPQVYAMLLSSFLWLAIHEGRSLHRKGAYALSPR